LDDLPTRNAHPSQRAAAFQRSPPVAQRSPPVAPSRRLTPAAYNPPCSVEHGVKRRPSFSAPSCSSSSGPASWRRRS